MGGSIQATGGTMLINAKPTASERVMVHLAHKKCERVEYIDRSLDSIATFVFFVVTRI
jgi:hypothetical protein